MVILGAGTFAREIAEEMNCHPLYVVDDIFYKGELDTVSFSQFDSWLMFDDFNEDFLCAIVSPKRKEFINKFTKWYFTKFIHPFTYVSKSTNIYKGCIICPGSIIVSNTIIKEHVIINRKVSIGHDCVIGPFSTISPGVNIAGNVEIGAESYIGLGANILEGRTIGNNCVIGAGSVVTKDVPSGESWWGVPAKFKRKSWWEV